MKLALVLASLAALGYALTRVVLWPWQKQPEETLVEQRRKAWR